MSFWNLASALRLPPEVLLKVFSWLESATDKQQVALVCRVWCTCMRLLVEQYRLMGQSPDLFAHLFPQIASVTVCGSALRPSACLSPPRSLQLLEHLPLLRQLRCDPVVCRLPGSGCSAGKLESCPQSELQHVSSAFAPNYNVSMPMRVSDVYAAHSCRHLDLTGLAALTDDDRIKDAEAVLTRTAARLSDLRSLVLPGIDSPCWTAAWMTHLDRLSALRLCSNCAQRAHVATALALISTLRRLEAHVTLDTTVSHFAALSSLRSLSVSFGKSGDAPSSRRA